MRRLLFLAVFMFGLAACGDQDGREPFAESRVPPGLAGRFFPPEGWAWGYVQSGGDPPQRYGVSAARGAPRGQLLIVTGAGETAEAWFESISDLNGRGVTVWVLERAGQAGSGRFASPRDLIHAPSFDADLAALKVMIALVIRAEAASPPVLMGQGDGAVVALAAAEDRQPVERLILSAPSFAPATDETPAETARRRLGLGTSKASDWRPWRRDGPNGVDLKLTHDPWRGGVQQAWQTANPDLRMSGASVAWRQALRESGLLAARRAKGLAVPTLMILPENEDPNADAVCAAMAACKIIELAGARPALHLESDRYRTPWLAGVETFTNDGDVPPQARGVGHVL